MKQLKQNKITIVIYERNNPIKVVDNLFINLTISNIGFNTIPEAVIEIRGLERLFSQGLVAELNKIGIYNAIYAIEIYAYSTDSLKREKVFAGSLIGGDIDSAPHNSLYLIAKVGVEQLGVFSIYQSQKGDTLKSLINKHFNKKNIAKSPAGNSSILSSSINFSLEAKAPEVVTLSDKENIKIEEEVLSYKFSDLLNYFIDKKPDIRYVWGTAKNTLGFYSFGKIQQLHYINSKDILHQVDISHNVTSVKIKGFFDVFKNIKVADGIKINSKIKSQINYTYQVIGITLELSNKLPIWFITLSCIITY